MSKISARLGELGITLPAPPKAVANYLPYTRAGNLVHMAGQIPKVGDSCKYVGAVVGSEKAGEGQVTVADAQASAKICMINFLANLQAACGGNLDRVKQIVKINVFVRSSPDFTGQPAVANGASDFLVEVWGDQGRHARAAVGVAQLPLGVSVEIDGVVEIDTTGLDSNL